jgi:integrase
VPLTVAQVHALAEAMPARCRAMVIAQAGLGLRVAELLALRVEDVDFLRRTVRGEWQTSPDGKQRVVPKTPRSRRTLPLPGVVAEALAAHMAAYQPADDGSLFTTAAGTMYRHEHYGSRIFANAARMAGLPPGTTSHHLRHHYASVLLAAVNPWSPWRSDWATRTAPWCSRRTAISCRTWRTEHAAPSTPRGPMTA